MSLRVGMRVKKVRGPGPVGVTGTVMGFNVSPLSHDCDIEIAVDQSVQCINGISEPGERVDAYAGHWEPIIPERNTVITWAECKEWQPEHIREGAGA